MAAHFQLHVNLVAHWKKQLLEGAPDVFASPGKGPPPADDPKDAELYEQIGRLQVELAFVKKNLPASVEWKRRQVEPGHPQLSVPPPVRAVGAEPVELLLRAGPGRPGGPAADGADRPAAHRAPFYGSRKLAIALSTPEAPVNRKRVQRLMRLMGLETLYCRPKTTVSGRGHKVYPYLPRGVDVVRPGQVWTRILLTSRCPRGSCTWRRRSTGTAGWSWTGGCRTRRMARSAGRCRRRRRRGEAGGVLTPEDTDRGVQFTARAWTGTLLAHPHPAAGYGVTQVDGVLADKPVPWEDGITPPSLPGGPVRNLVSGGRIGYLPDLLFLTELDTWT